MTKVRAKMTASVTTFEDGSTQVNMQTVVSGSEENKAFNDATPNGSVMLGIAAGKEAGKFFENGKSYYVDFTSAEEATPEVEGEAKAEADATATN